MKIEVFTREKFADSEEKGLLKKLSHFNKLVKSVRESRLYIIEGAYKKEEFENIASRVLCDFIVEDFSIGPRKTRGFVRVEMLFKEGITDVLAQSVSEAVEAAGFLRPYSSRTGRVFYIKGLCSKDACEAVRRCFANELIHSIKAG